MKKLLSVLLVMGILLSIAVPFTAFAETEGDFEYTISNDGATITDYTGSATELAIPNTLGGYPVTTIGGSAFSHCNSLTSVTIPNSVTTIWYEAFRYCDNLTSVTIPDSVTTIGEEAFRYCDNLTSVTIGNSVATIGARAFGSCKNLTSITVDDKNANYCDVDGVLFNKAKTELIQYPNGNTRTSYSIPGSVTTIGNYAFSYCTNLTSVTIPDSVTTIGYWAFCDCDSLTSVTIPNSVTTIGDSAFYDCDSLTSITVDDKNANYCDVDGVLFNKDKTILMQYPIGNTRTSYSIPGSVTTIEYGAFKDCDSLTTVTIPDSVTTMDGSAFKDCDSLTSITVDDKNANYSDINGVLFNKAKTILIQYPIGNTRITYSIPDSVTTIWSGVFKYCKSLTTVTIPNSVTTIGEEAFSGCDNLTSVTILDGVTTLESNLFSGCANLTWVTIPDSVTTIYYGAFSDCPQVTIIGKEGSYAESYAKENGIPFEIYAAYGDIDEDFKVTAADSLVLLKSVVGKVTLTEKQFQSADTDGNGQIEAVDALNILKKVVGKIDRFPVKE